MTAELVADALHAVAAFPTLALRLAPPRGPELRFAAHRRSTGRLPGPRVLTLSTVIGS